MTTTILQPGAIERPFGDIPYLHMPQRNGVFRERAERLRKLADGHAMHDYLLFVAHLCDAQQAALHVFPEVPLPTEAQLALCREHGMPPLSVQSWVRDPAWRETLGLITLQMLEPVRSVARDTLLRLRRADGDVLEKTAGAVLSGQYEDIEFAFTPFVAAALQVYWVHMASTLGERAIGRSDMPGLCPVCASQPVASVVRIGGPEQGLRYLSCSLCETQWHMVRVKCSSCESTKGISYFMVEGSSGAVKAEACEECGSYLKIMYLEQDPYADPVADDLATLTLDLLMGDRGTLRSGPNLFLLTDSGESS